MNFEVLRCHLPKNKHDELILFDVDGTLTQPRQCVTTEVLEHLTNLRQSYTVGIVGGSDLSKQMEQLGQNVLEGFDYVFAENGLHAFCDAQEIHRQSIVKHLGDDALNEIVNITLLHLSLLSLPKKRGTFFELRNGMINVSPIGRNCTTEERVEFEVYDNEHKIREKLVETLRFAYGNRMNLCFSIGGQISFDIIPKGWDKTYCLRHITNRPQGDDCQQNTELYTKIHFFGDKTHPGGNDYELYSHPAVHGYKVQSYRDTLKILKDHFL